MGNYHKQKGGGGGGGGGKEREREKENEKLCCWLMDYMHGQKTRNVVHIDKQSNFASRAAEEHLV